MAANESDPNTYECAGCGGTFTSRRSDEDAETEAEALWGVKDAASNPGMAIVCDDCFKAIVAEDAHG